MNDPKEALNNLDNLDGKKFLKRYAKLLLILTFILIILNQINTHTLLDISTIDLLIIFIAYKLAKYLTKKYKQKD